MAESATEKNVRGSGERAVQERLIETVSLQSTLGDQSKTISNAFLGHNIHGGISPIPENRDNQGLTFFTRPRLNLSYDNAAVSRILLPIVEAPMDSLQRALRVYLDPVSERGGSTDSHFRGGYTGSIGGGKYGKRIRVETITSPMVDPRSPFIPLLSNTLLSLSGWPDETLDTYTSEPGIGKESYSIADTYIRNFETFDLTATFRNIQGDPVTALLRIWMEYMGRVMEGSMTPWPDSLMESEIDYQTRIFRIVLDPTRKQVQKIGSAMAGFPTANPLGASFNYNQERPYAEDNTQITMPIRCVGCEYNDPILITEFNDISFMFNASLEASVLDGGRTPGMDYIKISAADYSLFKSRAYPVIDELTWELTWWTSKEQLAYIRSKFSNNN